MKRIGLLSAVVALFALACAGSPAAPKQVGITRIGDRAVIANGLLAIELDLPRGTWSAFGPDDELFIRGATCGVDPEEAIGGSPLPGGSWSFSAADGEDRLGRGKRVLFEAPPGTAALGKAAAITLYEGQGFFTVSETVTNRAQSTIRVMEMRPVETVEGGGVFVGRRLATHRILDNSSSLVPEIYVNIIPGDRVSSALWNQTIHDLESRKTLTTGFLDFERGMPILSARPLPDTGASSGGREGWSYSASVGLAPGKPLPPGASLTSETLYVDFTSLDPLDGLEQYARAIAAFLGKQPWRGRVPSGWNAWGGGGGQGGYGQDVNEEILLENLDFMATNFKPFGQEYFQVDDGWEVSPGDWATNTARFPHGMKWLAGEIAARGFLPGLWMAPFDAEATFSPPATPEQVDIAWTIPTKSILGVPCERSLDLSNPQAIEWASRLFETAAKDWGNKWVKLDFGYCALLYNYMFPRKSTQFDMGLTFAEVYRQGMKGARRAMGDDTFFLGISGTGLNYDIVDGMRISLDNMPWWEAESAGDAWANGPANILCYPVGKACFAQGMKPTARTVARRYYLHERVWVNHPDMMFFRPPVATNEALAFASLVAMSGGVAKLGDRVVEMGAFGVDVYRRLLPVYGKSGRPIDLFTRELPEVWDLKIARPFEIWDVVGLFNWGTNLDLTSNPYQMIREAARSIGVELSALDLDPGADYLAYEFWRGELLGHVTGALSVSVEPRNVKLIGLRRSLGRPQLLGTNRHFTMGGEDIDEVIWDGKSGSLEVTLTASTGTRWKGKNFPFEHELAFYVPEGYALAGIDSEPPSVAEVRENSGNVLKIALRAGQGEKIKLILVFAR